ncbi:MAG: hypothetical protein ACOH5I_05370 [Oligoflexus sp.]
MESTQFLEIEHKYIIPDSWDFSAFLKRLQGLDLQSSSEVQVSDTYFVTQACPGYIYRHRYDIELQHLTVKSLTGDPEVRLEVNLDLGHHKGNQKDAIHAFLTPLNILWSGTLAKKVRAFYFKNCEVVYYEAEFQQQSVTCVEIEAKNSNNVSQAKQILRQYAESLNLDVRYRSDKTLFELLLAPNMPQELAKHFKR